MARHRLLPHTEEPGLVCRSPRALVVGRFDQHRRATLRQWVIRMTRSSALSIASITSLVLACAVSGAAGRVPPPAPALPRVAITPVAIDGAAGSAVSGPAVVRGCAAASQPTYCGGHQVGSAVGHQVVAPISHRTPRSGG